MAPKAYTLAEVAKHSEEKDIWLIIGNDKTGKTNVPVRVLLCPTLSIHLSLPLRRRVQKAYFIDPSP